MKDVEKLTGKRKERKKKKKKLRKKALKFLKEHKGKAYTKEELKEKMDLGEELSGLMDDTPLTASSSLWYFLFGGPTIESEREDLETYYYYRFDWRFPYFWVYYGFFVRAWPSSLWYGLG